jgi:hypothetical protein
MGHRGEHTETVDIISRELLTSVLTAAITDEASGGREILKPENMSKLSPRIFWSMIRHFGNDFHSAYKTLFPVQTDWNWLNDRKRELSEKAQQNLQQAQEKAKRAAERKNKSVTKCSNKSAGELVNGATQASDSDADVPAMDTEAEGCVTDNWNVPLSIKSTYRILSRESLDNVVGSEYKAALIRALAGISKRSSSSSSSSSAAAAAAAAAAGTGASSSGATSSIQPPKILVFANTDAVLLCKAINECKAASMVDVDLDQVQAWIEAARDAVVSCMWKCVCGGSSLLLCALHRADVLTLAAFAVWVHSPETLITMLSTIDPNISTMYLNDLLGVDHTLFDVQYVLRATQVCRKLLEEYVWLGGYIDCEAMEIAKMENEETSAQGEPEGGVDVLPECADGDDVWLYTKESCTAIGCRVRVYTSESQRGVDDDDDDGDGDGDDIKIHSAFPLHSGSKSSPSTGWWEDGTVVAYLPATDDEPMALWRVCMDSHAKAQTQAGLSSTISINKSPIESCKFIHDDMLRPAQVYAQRKCARIEDLEEEEIIAALKAYENSVKVNE